MGVVESDNLNSQSNLQFSKKKLSYLEVYCTERAIHSIRGEICEIALDLFDKTTYMIMRKESRKEKPLLNDLRLIEKNKIYDIDGNSLSLNEIVQTFINFDNTLLNRIKWLYNVAEKKPSIY